MSQKVEPSLLTLSIELVYCILDHLLPSDILLSVRDFCPLDRSYDVLVSERSTQLSHSKCHVLIVNLSNLTQLSVDRLHSLSNLK